MLALLAEFVMQIMARICEAPISRYSENLQTKRSVLAKLLELYNATEVLLAASEHAANEFRSYSDGTETVTRIVSAKRLTDVHEKFEAFSKCIDETSGVLKIYDVGC